MFWFYNYVQKIKNNDVKSENNIEFSTSKNMRNRVNDLDDVECDEMTKTMVTN